MENRTEKSPEFMLAEKIRQTCIESAREGFMEASMSGLCSEGALEAAISAMQKLDLDEVISVTKEEFVNRQQNAG